MLASLGETLGDSTVELLRAPATVLLTRKPAPLDGTLVAASMAVCGYVCR